MKSVCDGCKFKKEKSSGIFCIKYGIPIYQRKMFCIGKENEGRTYVEQVRQQEDGS